MGSKRRIFSATEGVLAVQGHSRSSKVDDVGTNRKRVFLPLSHLAPSPIASYLTRYKTVVYGSVERVQFRFGIVVLTIMVSAQEAKNKMGSCLGLHYYAHLKMIAVKKRLFVCWIFGLSVATRA